MHLAFIRIAGIRRDGGTQARVRTSEEWVEEMREAFLAGAKLPAIVVFRDRKRIDWLADGFHRLEGWIRAYPQAQTIQADVREGELRDAILHALGCNRKHGLHRSNDDKRRAVQIMLDDPEWTKWSDPRIAEQCGVSVEFVRGRRILQQKEDAPREVERGGSTYTLTPPGPRAPRPKPTPEVEAAKANAIDDLKAAAEAVCAFPELDFERRNIERLARRLAPDYEPDAAGRTCSLCGQTVPPGD